MGVLRLGRGDHAGAAEVLGDLVGRDTVALHGRVLPDLVEAAVRSGDRELAGGRPRSPDQPRPGRWSAPGPRACWPGRGPSSRADDQAEAFFLRAVGLLGQIRAPGDLARAHLLYGEWLRGREDRARDARDHLRTA